jgi:hypothetical protein
VVFQSSIFGQILAILGSFGQIWAEFATLAVVDCMPELWLKSLTPKGPMSVDGFFGSSGRLSRCQKHERSSEILKEGGPM